MKGLLSAANLAGAALTLLPLSRSKRWWVRDLDFPRLQLAGLIGTLALANARRGRRKGLAVSLACLAYQLKWILPYSPARRRQVPDARTGGPRLRLLTANVLQSNRRAAEFLALVREAAPDVIAVVETDAWWERRLRALERDYPYTVKRPLENEYGMLVYSRLPLEDARVRFLVEDDVPSISAKARLADGSRVDLHFLHPEPPRPDSEGSEKRDAELMIVARELVDGRPTVVAGDLNDVAWSRTTRRFLRESGLLDPRVGRGMLNTFHARWRLLRWPLDHVFHSRHFALGRLERLRGFGSDHFPVLVELVREPDGARPAGRTRAPRGGPARRPPGSRR